LFFGLGTFEVGVLGVFGDRFGGLGQVDRFGVDGGGFVCSGTILASSCATKVADIACTDTATLYLLTNYSVV
jgi:hypothetical protein